VYLYGAKNQGHDARFVTDRWTTSYRSSVETIALKCLVFEKIALFCILATDKQTDKQTDGQLRCTKPLSLSRLNNRGKLHQRTNSYNLCTSV